MAAPFSNLQEKTELALASVVSGLGLSSTTVLGTDTANHTQPAVVCSVDGVAEEVEEQTGIYTLSASVTVEHQAADTTSAAHGSAVATVFDAFRDDVLAATLTAARTDYYVYEVIQRGEEPDNDERIWRKRILLDIICCASDIG